MNDVSLREHIREILAEKDIRRDGQFADLAKALLLQTEETDRRLKAYPTLRDFNDLKSRVDTIVALFQVLGALSVILGALAAFLTYAKP
jgi:hypothetical protein